MCTCSQDFCDNIDSAFVGGIRNVRQDTFTMCFITVNLCRLDCVIPRDSAIGFYCRTPSAKQISPLAQ